MSFLGSSRGNPGSFVFLSCLLLLSNSSSQVLWLISLCSRMALRWSFHPAPQLIFAGISVEFIRQTCFSFLTWLHYWLSTSLLLLYWGWACSICNKLCELIVTSLQQHFIWLLLPISYSLGKKQLCFSSVFYNCLPSSRGASSPPLLNAKPFPSRCRIWFNHPSSPVLASSPQAFCLLCTEIFNNHVYHTNPIFTF